MYLKMNIRAIKQATIYGLAITLLLLLAAYSKQTSVSAANKGDLEKLTFNYLGSPGTVTPLELAEDLGFLAPIKLNYQGVSIGGPQGIQSALQGDSDISSQAFVGSVVKMVASGAPGTAVIAAYGTFKDLYTGYYVLDNSPIKSARDLIGKKVATNIMGAQVEYMFRDYLKRGGLTPQEISQVTLIVVPPGTGEQALRQHHVDVAPLYGPAIDRGGVRKLFQDYDLFGDLTTGAYVMSNRYIAANPNTTRKVVGGIAQAIEWSRSHPKAEVIARMQSIIKKRARGENDAMVKYWNGWGVPATGGQFNDHEFQLWIDWLVKDGQFKQGLVTPKKVYSNAYNPYANK